MLYSPPLLCTCGWFSSPVAEGNERGTRAAAPKRRRSSGARASFFGSKGSVDCNSEWTPRGANREGGGRTVQFRPWVTGRCLQGDFILPDFFELDLPITHEFTSTHVILYIPADGVVFVIVRNNAATVTFVSIHLKTKYVDTRQTGH